MSWLSAIALLKRVPGIVWVALFVLAFLVAGGTAMYYKGTHDAVRRGHQIALVDSTRTAVARKDTAVAHSDAAIAVAKKAQASTSALLARRVAVRQAALGELLDTLPKIHELVAIDDSIAASAQVTVAVDSGAFDTFLVERAAHERVDTLRVNTIALDVTPPKESHLVRNTLIVAGAVTAVVKGPSIVRGLVSLFTGKR